MEATNAQTNENFIQNQQPLQMTKPCLFIGVQNKPHDLVNSRPTYRWSDLRLKDLADLRVNKVSNLGLTIQHQRLNKTHQATYDLTTWTSYNIMRLKEAGLTWSWPRENPAT